MIHPPLLIPLAFVLMAVAAPASSATTPSGIYHEFCEHCHTPGIAGAPRLGDTAEWARRIRTGKHLLLQSAIEGVPNTAMPPRGGHRQLTDAQLRDVVDFMVQAAALPADMLQAATRYEAHGINNREFAAMDRDLDGALLPAEVRHDPHLARAFPRFDANRDGRLSETEYLALERALDKERAAARVDDATLALQVAAALRAVPEMPEHGIKIEAANGAVVIAGIVKNADLARRGYLAIRRIPGIRSIDNRLISGEVIGWD